MKGFALKKKKFYSAFTLLLVPEDKGHVHSWRLPPWVTKAVSIGSVVILLSVSYFLISYISLNKRVKELQYLETIQGQQEEEIRQLKETAAQMQERVEAVGSLDQTIRQMVGLDGTKEQPTAPSRGATSDLVDQIRQLGGRDNASRGGQVSLTELRSTLEALDGELKADESQLTKLGEDVSARLKYLAAIPSNWPVKGSITSPFGTRQSPFGGRQEYHNGLDIAAPFGSVIVAAADGTVTSTGWKSGFGQVVTIDHGFGFVTQYAHCSAFLVKPGDEVKRGQPIAKVGSNGRSTGPHLHFIVEKNGQETDPMKYLNNQDNN